MVQNLTKLKDLIKEYSRLCRLEGLTFQNRGQRLNFFIAELLQCFGIEAIANIRKNGEIDVGFELDGKRFIVEAKWEKKPIGTGAIAKLQKRLRQRLGGTVGLFLSMSDFSSEAKKDLKEGEQLMVLLLSRSHFEAILSGFIHPQELINKLITKASLYGEGFIPLQSLFETLPSDELEISFSSPDEIVEGELIVESMPSFKASIIASNLPFGQSGVAEFSKNKVLLTLKQGIYLLDYKKQTIDILFKIPNCSRNVLVNKDGAIFIVRKNGIGCFKDGKFCIVGGGFYGNICLFHGENEDVWVFANGYPREMDGLYPIVAKLGKSLGEEKYYKIDFPPGYGTNAALISQNRFLIIGSNGGAIIESGVSKQTIGLGTNSMGLAHLPSGKFIIASNGVELLELDISSISITQVAKFKLQGSVSELTESMYGGGYLFSHYSKTNGRSAGVLIRWRY